MTSIQEKELTDLLEATEITDVRDLVVYNDDFNTFDHVIATLMRVCKHSPEQAEQCAFIVHYKGKCDVKHDSYERLAPKKRALNQRGLEATIEKAWWFWIICRQRNRLIDSGSRR